MYHDIFLSKLWLMFRTFALVNCTIGPSSDTTWFPTWMNGILPKKRRKSIWKVFEEFPFAFDGATSVPINPDRPNTMKWDQTKTQKSKTFFQVKTLNFQHQMGWIGDYFCNNNKRDFTLKAYASCNLQMICLITRQRDKRAPLQQHVY